MVRDSLYTWIGELNIVNKSVFPTCSMESQFPAIYLLDIKKLIPKYI